MNENNETPIGAAPAPEGAPQPTPTPQPEQPVQAAAPEAAPVPAPTPEPTPTGAPVAAPPAPEPQAAAAAPYAAQPAPAPQPVPTAPVSPIPALVCGILSILFCGIPIVGIILGIVAIVMAGKYFKAGGTEGTAKGGKICGIVGIVLSVIMIILACVLVFIGLNELKEGNITVESASVASSQNAPSAAVPAEDEQAIFAVVDPYLEQIKNKDPQMVASIASLMEASLNEELADLNITLADCGVDSQEMALAMMDGFDYEPSSVTEEGATAEANYDVTVRSCNEIGQTFYDSIVEVFADVEAGSMTEEEVYQTIGQELMAAIQSAAPESGNLWDVDLSNTTGTWIMDSESWDDELDYFFVLE